MQALCLTSKDAYLEGRPKRLGDFSYNLGNMHARSRGRGKPEYAVANGGKLPATFHISHVEQKPGNLSVHVAPSDIVKLLSACCA